MIKRFLNICIHTLIFTYIYIDGALNITRAGRLIQRGGQPQFKSTRAPKAPPHGRQQPYPQETISTTVTPLPTQQPSFLRQIQKLDPLQRQQPSKDPSGFSIPIESPSLAPQPKKSIQPFDPFISSYILPTEAPYGTKKIIPDPTNRQSLINAFSIEKLFNVDIRPQIKKDLETLHNKNYSVTFITANALAQLSNAQLLFSLKPSSDWKDIPGQHNNILSTINTGNGAILIQQSNNPQTELVTTLADEYGRFNEFLREGLKPIHEKKIETIQQLINEQVKKEEQSIEIPSPPNPPAEVPAEIPPAAAEGEKEAKPQETEERKELLKKEYLAKRAIFEQLKAKKELLEKQATESTQKLDPIQKDIALKAEQLKELKDQQEKIEEKKDELEKKDVYLMDTKISLAVKEKNITQELESLSAKKDTLTKQIDQQVIKQEKEIEALRQRALEDATKASAKTEADEEAAKQRDAEIIAQRDAARKARIEKEQKKEVDEDYARLQDIIERENEIENLEKDLKQAKKEIQDIEEYKGIARGLVNIAIQNIRKKAAQELARIERESNLKLEQIANKRKLLEQQQASTQSDKEQLDRELENFKREQEETKRFFEQKKLEIQQKRDTELKNIEKEFEQDRERLIREYTEPALKEIEGRQQQAQAERDAKEQSELQEFTEKEQTRERERKTVLEKQREETNRLRLETEKEAEAKIQAEETELQRLEQNIKSLAAQKQAAQVALDNAQRAAKTAEIEELRAIELAQLNAEAELKLKMESLRQKAQDDATAASARREEELKKEVDEDYARLEDIIKREEEIETLKKDLKQAKEKIQEIEEYKQTARGLANIAIQNIRKKAAQETARIEQATKSQIEKIRNEKEQLAKERTIKNEKALEDLNNQEAELKISSEEDIARIRQKRDAELQRLAEKFAQEEQSIKTDEVGLENIHQLSQKIETERKATQSRYEQKRKAREIKAAQELSLAQQESQSQLENIENKRTLLKQQQASTQSEIEQATSDEAKLEREKQEIEERFKQKRLEIQQKRDTELKNIEKEFEQDRERLIREYTEPALKEIAGRQQQAQTERDAQEQSELQEFTEQEQTGERERKTVLEKQREEAKALRLEAEKKAEEIIQAEETELQRLDQNIKSLANQKQAAQIALDNARGEAKKAEVEELRAREKLAQLKAESELKLKKARPEQQIALKKEFAEAIRPLQEEIALKGTNKQSIQKTAQAQQEILADIVKDEQIAREKRQEETVKKEKAELLKDGPGEKEKIELSHKEPIVIPIAKAIIPPMEKPILPPIEVPVPPIAPPATEEAIITPTDPELVEPPAEPAPEIKSDIISEVKPTAKPIRPSQKPRQTTSQEPSAKPARPRKEKKDIEWKPITRAEAAAPLSTTHQSQFKLAPRKFYSFPGYAYTPQPRQEPNRPFVEGGAQYRPSEAVSQPIEENIPAYILETPIIQPFQRPIREKKPDIEFIEDYTPAQYSFITPEPKLPRKPAIPPKEKPSQETTKEKTTKKEPDGLWNRIKQTFNNIVSYIYNLFNF